MSWDSREGLSALTHHCWGDLGCLAAILVIFVMKLIIIFGNYLHQVRLLIGQLSEDRLVPEHGGYAIRQSKVREDLILESY